MLDQINDELHLCTGGTVACKNDQNI